MYIKAIKVLLKKEHRGIQIILGGKVLWFGSVFLSISISEMVYILTRNIFFECELFDLFVFEVCLLAFFWFVLFLAELVGDFIGIGVFRMRFLKNFLVCTLMIWIRVLNRICMLEKFFLFKSWKTMQITFYAQTRWDKLSFNVLILKYFSIALSSWNLSPKLYFSHSTVTQLNVAHTYNLKNTTELFQKFS